jgi:hypothetical protein
MTLHVDDIHYYYLLNLHITVLQRDERLLELIKNGPVITLSTKISRMCVLYSALYENN